MEYQFYIDVFFLAEFVRDLLALFLTAALAGRRIIPKRLFAAAALGSLWSVAVLFLPVPMALKLLVGTILAGSSVTALAFSLKKPKDIFLTALLLLISCALLGGGLQFFRQYFALTAWESLFVMASLCAAFWAFFRGRRGEKARGRERYLVRLYYRGKEREFLALADTGNRLREPVGGRPVSVISYGDCIDFCEKLSAVIYIPYRAVGTAHGVLPGIIFERMEIQKGEDFLEIERPIVAVTKEPLSKGGDFNMLLPEELILERGGLI